MFQRSTCKRSKNETNKENQSPGFDEDMWFQNVLDVLPMSSVKKKVKTSGRCRSRPSIDPQLQNGEIHVIFTK